MSSVRLSLTALAAAAVLALAPPARATTSSAETWWQILYLGHADGYEPGDHSDADPYTDGQEFAGRTDPLDDGDKPDFLWKSVTYTTIFIPGGGEEEDEVEGIRLQANWWGHGGVHYRVEYTEDDEEPYTWYTWTEGLTVPIIGENDLVAINVVREGEPTGIRLHIWDPDSDGDGFTDWQEFLAGTDPYDNQDFPTLELTDGDDDGFSHFVEWLIGQSDAHEDWALDTDGSSKLLEKTGEEDDLMVILPGTGVGLIEINPIAAETAPPMRVVAL